MMVACQWKRSSPTGPALQLAGGSFARSCSSLLIRFDAIAAVVSRKKSLLPKEKGEPARDAESGRARAKGSGKSDASRLALRAPREAGRGVARRGE